MDQEQNLRIKIERVIALKRYEQPPPGYFNALPNRIMARIERGEESATFWEKLWPNFAVRPSLAYALGLTVFGALTAGLFYVPARPALAATGEVLRDGQFADALPSADEDSQTIPKHGLQVVQGFNSTYPVPAPHNGGTFTSFQETRAVPASLYLLQQ